jgi:site-specific DNA-methyltransferase (cytosine-N4-specific)
MLTDPGDVVFDPFAGSCVTGEVCERLSRHWICCDLVEDYLRGALGRFTNESPRELRLLPAKDPDHPDNYYRIPRPGILWDGVAVDPLPEDGGKKRPKVAKNLSKKGPQP